MSHLLANHGVDAFGHVDGLGRRYRLNKPKRLTVSMRLYCDELPRPGSIFRIGLRYGYLRFEQQRPEGAKREVNPQISQM